MVSVSSAGSDSSTVSAATSALRSSSMSANPPVRSSSIGAFLARLRASSLHALSSWAAISSGLQVRTPAASTAPTNGSLWPMSPVPRTHPIIAWMRLTRLPHVRSACHLATIASRAALASPYDPSPPNLPRLGDPGSTTCRVESMSASCPTALSPPMRRSTDQSRTRMSSSVRAPTSVRSPITCGAANGISNVGRMAGLTNCFLPPRTSIWSFPIHSMTASTSA